MGASTNDTFFGSDDWFISTDHDQRLLIAGFDRNIRLDEETEAFVIELRAACLNFVGHFNVIFWCGPGVDRPDACALRQFEILVKRLRREGAKRFGLVAARGADVDFDALEERLGGPPLVHAQALAELEKAFAARPAKRPAQRAKPFFSLMVN